MDMLMNGQTQAVGTAAMMSPPRRPAKPSQPATLDWTGICAERVAYAASAVIFAQGDATDSVLYVLSGTVRLSVLSRTGKEAVVAVLTAGHFFGEGCLAGQTHRTATATTMSAAVVLAIEREEMTHQLRTQPAFARAFMTHMLTRSIRMEEDLLDQLFNSTEKRLARTLLLLARDAEPEAARRPLPRVSQELLAEMVGTTRSRVNFFMNRFRKLGFVQYEHNCTFTINDSLRTVIVSD